MSMHKSLRLKSALKRERNVLGRYERILVMKERGTWTEGRSIYALPKTRVRLSLQKK